MIFYFGFIWLGSRGILGLLE
ncbi:hypothetical protein XFF6992_190116 [Xanthomonas citri pv. fuscans]|nr:hypothetical protein XFF6992_190116 [Xanthomonas citri pv. fuscans]SOO30798.1 hypothetical protein XFF6994_1160005 [Xanthomonas citri pv. fuscans]